MPQDRTPFLGQPCGDPVGGIDRAQGKYGTYYIMTVNPDGSINVNVIGGGGGGNPAAGLTGSAVPTYADYLGFNVGGILVGVSSTNPLPVTSEPLSSISNAPADSVVGTVSSQVVAANPARKGLTLTNISYQTVSLAFGTNAAVLFSGITLGPGGSYWMDSYEFTTAAVNAIATASANLSIQETQ